jgi:hypothetical protein
MREGHVLAVASEQVRAVEKTTIILFQRRLPDLTVQEGRLSLR